MRARGIDRTAREKEVAGAEEVGVTWEDLGAGPLLGDPG